MATPFVALLAHPVVQAGAEAGHVGAEVGVGGQVPHLVRVGLEVVELDLGALEVTLDLLGGEGVSG